MLEGTLTPSLAFRIAQRNGLDTAQYDPAKGAVARAQSSSPDAFVYCPGEDALNAFLTEYNRCSGVYRKEQDFYDVMMDYLKRAAADGVKRAEVFFDPQQHCFTDTSGAGAGPSATSSTSGRTPSSSRAGSTSTHQMATPCRARTSSRCSTGRGPCSRR